MIRLHSAILHESGAINYVMAFVPQVEGSIFLLNGDEKIIHNGIIHPTTGGTGIPSVADTNFYSIYKASI